MRVILVALAFSFCSFLAGVAGDLSMSGGAAQAAPQPAQIVRLALPPALPIATATAEAAAPTRAAFEASIIPAKPVREAKLAHKQTAADWSKAPFKAA